MSEVTLAAADPGAVEVRLGATLLFRYVFQSTVPGNESPRPYLHPMYSVDGDILTNFRPNDHPWHHALSLTLTSVDGINFWGGPSYRPGEGYRWRDDHGRQVHVRWIRQEPKFLEHVVEWQDPKKQQTLLEERRTLAVVVEEQGWSLRWTSALLNTSRRTLRMDNYHSSGGLDGSHYTGLQFRGARGLLDDHGDKTIDVVGAEEVRGEAALHGRAGEWLEWHAQHDTSLRRTRLRFENLSGPIPWFVRRNLPVVGFAFHRSETVELKPDEVLTLDHRLSFLRT